MRAVVAAVATFILLVLVASRMAYLQIVSRDHFSTLSQENKVELVPVGPPRGLIYDRNGIVLAENLSSYRLEITPPGRRSGRDVDAIGQHYRNRRGERSRFYTELKRTEPFIGIPLLFDLSARDLGAFAVNRHRFPGVDVVSHANRRYPTRPLAAHAVGHVRRINKSELAQLNPKDYNGTSRIGKLGIEKYYEDILHGKAGYQHVKINAQGDRCGSWIKRRRRRGPI
jgi:penicillin-binding protein 2